MNKKIILGMCLVLIMLCLMPQVSAKTIGYFKQNEPANLIITAYDINKAQAGVSIVCNATIRNPKNEYVAVAKEMSNLGFGDYNLSVPSINHSVVGRYIGKADCYDTTSGKNGAGVFDYYVSYSGEPEKERNTIPLIVGFLVFIAFFSAMGLFSDQLPVRILSFGIAVIEILLLAGILYFAEVGALLSNLLKINFLGLLFIGLALIIYTIIHNSMKAIAMKEEEKIGKWERRNKWE